jgi:hypothetical protein
LSGRVLGPGDRLELQPWSMVLLHTNDEGPMLPFDAGGWQSKAKSARPGSSPR